MSKNITSREKDYAQWYNDLIIKGGWQTIVRCGDV